MVECATRTIKWVTPSENFIFSGLIISSRQDQLEPCTHFHIFHLFFFISFIFSAPKMGNQQIFRLYDSMIRFNHRHGRPSGDGDWIMGVGGVGSIDSFPSFSSSSSSYQDKIGINKRKMERKEKKKKWMCVCVCVCVCMCIASVADVQVRGFWSRGHLWIVA